MEELGTISLRLISKSSRRSSIRATGKNSSFFPRKVKKLQELEGLNTLPTPIVDKFLDMIEELEKSHFPGQKDLTEHVKRARLLNHETWNTKAFVIQDFADFHDGMVSILSAADCPIVSATDEQDSTRPNKRPRHEKTMLATNQDEQKKGPCEICQKIKGIPERVINSHDTEDHDDDLISRRYKKTRPNKSDFNNADSSEFPKNKKQLTKLLDDHAKKIRKDTMEAIAEWFANLKKAKTGKKKKPGSQKPEEQNANDSDAEDEEFNKVLN